MPQALNPSGVQRVRNNMLNKLLNLLIPSKPTLPENDLIKITSQEVVGDMEIFHGICKKKVLPKDIAPLTKIIEEMYKTDVFISVDPTDSHIVKFVFKVKK